MLKNVRSKDSKQQLNLLCRFVLRETPPINDDHGHGDAALDQAETPATTIVQDDDANNAGGRDHDASNTDSGGNDANIAEDINNSFQHDIIEDCIFKNTRRTMLFSRT